MSMTTDFVGELVRDANRIAYLDTYQKRRMLERAVLIIRELREEIGLPQGPGRDALLDIHTTALAIERGWRNESEITQAFLTAATMIRDLHVILDSGTTVTLV